MGFVFLHVPKTGGISVATALGGVGRGNHVKASTLSGFVAAFVRDPYTRLHSAFKFSQSAKYDVPTVPKTLTFRDFVLERHFLCEPRGMFNSMSYWLDAPVGFLGRYEYLQQDFERLCDILGIEHKLTLPWEHKMGGSSVAAYDDAMKAVVRECYADDFERYGYDS